MFGGSNRAAREKYRNSIMAPSNDLETGGKGKGVHLLEDTVTYAGPMYKFNRSGQMGLNPWRLRFFLVNTEDGSLKYYTSKKAYKKGESHRDFMHIIEVDTIGEQANVAREHRMRFNVAVKNETSHSFEQFVLNAKNQKQYDLWSDVFKRAVENKHERIEIECKGCTKKEAVDVHPSIGHMLLQYGCSHCGLIQTFNMPSHSIEILGNTNTQRKADNETNLSAAVGLGEADLKNEDSEICQNSSASRRFTPRPPQHSPPNTVLEDIPCTDNNNDIDKIIETSVDAVGHAEDNKETNGDTMERDDDSEISIPPLSEMEADTSASFGTKDDDNKDSKTGTSINGSHPDDVDIDISNISSLQWEEEGSDVIFTSDNYKMEMHTKSNEPVFVTTNVVTEEEKKKSGPSVGSVEGNDGERRLVNGPEILDPEEDDEHKSSVVSKEQLIQELSRLNHSEILTALSAVKLGLDKSSLSELTMSPGEQKTSTWKIASTEVVRGHSNEVGAMNESEACVQREEINESLAAFKRLETSVEEINQRSADAVLESKNLEAMSTPTASRLKLWERHSNLGTWKDPAPEISIKSPSQLPSPLPSSLNPPSSSSPSSPITQVPISSMSINVQPRTKRASSNKISKPFKYKTEKPSYIHPRQRSISANKTSNYLNSDDQQNEVDQQLSIPFPFSSGASVTSAPFSSGASVTSAKLLPANTQRKSTTNVFRIDKDKFESYGNIEDDLDSLCTAPTVMEVPESVSSAPSVFYFEERLDINDLPHTTKEFQVYARLSKLSEVELQKEVADNDLVGYKFRTPHEAKMAIVNMGQASRASRGSLRRSFTKDSSLRCSLFDTDDIDMNSSGVSSLRGAKDHRNEDSKSPSDLLMEGRSVSASMQSTPKSLFNSRGNVGTNEDPYYYTQKITEPPTGVKEFQDYCKLSKSSNMNLNKQLVKCGLDKYKFRSTHESVMAIISEREKLEAERRREARRSTRMAATPYQKDRPESPPTSITSGRRPRANVLKYIKNGDDSTRIDARFPDMAKKYFFTNKLTETTPLNAKQNVLYGKMSGMSSMALDIELAKHFIDKFAFRNNHEKVMGIISMRFNTMLDQRCFGVNIPTAQTSSINDTAIEKGIKVEIPASAILENPEAHSPNSSMHKQHDKRQLETMNTTEIATKLRMCNLSPEKYNYNKFKMVNALLATDENKIASLFQKKAKKGIETTALPSKQKKVVSLAEKISSKITVPDCVLKMKFNVENALDVENQRGNPVDEY